MAELRPALEAADDAVLMQTWQMRRGEQVQVIDNASGEDITAQTLAQVALQARDQAGPDLPVADVREQPGRHQQVHHHPRRQVTHPDLTPAGLGQDLIDHLERHQASQFAQMTWREHARGYRHRPSYGNLISQRSSRFKGVLE